MGRGLALSIFLHGVLMAWALISFAGTKPLKPPEVVPVEVAVISPDDLVRLRKGSRDSKKLETQPARSEVKPEKKKAKQERKVAAATPPPPPPPKAEPPEPKPSKDDIAAKLAALEKKRETEARQKAEAAKKAAAEKARAEAEARKQAAEAARKKAAAEAKRKAAEARRERRLAEKRRKEQERKRKLAEQKRREREAREKKKQFDAGNIAALLNKIPDAAAPDAGSQWKPETKKNLPKGPAAGAPEGKDTQLTASQRSLLGVMMKRAVSSCWRVQTGMQGADQLVVDLEVRLKPDGTLDGDPRVMNRRGGALFADAAINATRALQQCAPYDLPKDLYKGGWDHMVVTFDPQKMF